MNIELRPSTRRMIDSSPAKHEAMAFINWLLDERYTDFTIDCHLRRLLFVMPRLWPDASQPVLKSADLITVFAQEKQPRSRFLVFASTRRAYTRYLSAQGRLVPEPPLPFEELIRRYDQYLTEVRGLSVSTRTHHKVTIYKLLTSVLNPGQSLQVLSHDHLEQFIFERSQTLSRHSLQHEIAHLRAFLRYGYDQGLIYQRLDELDAPRTYRYEQLPCALDWPSVQQLLQSIDCNSRSGWRDLCILHLIACYGLRPIEVVSLRLDSIDWEQALLHVYQSKTHSSLTLPLEASTLKLLHGYLQQGRVGDTDSAMLFLRARCPYIPLERTAVGDIFRKRMREAGLPDYAKHVYRLRHTFAMQLLGRGVGMKDIGDVLGHRSFYGTRAYLRLDAAMLQGVGLPVPCLTGDSHD